MMSLEKTPMATPIPKLASSGGFQSPCRLFNTHRLDGHDEEKESGQPSGAMASI
jgi:hypothetical protein